MWAPEKGIILVRPLNFPERESAWNRGYLLSNKTLFKLFIKQRTFLMNSSNEVANETSLSYVSI